jgi:hypothetical protein
MSWTNILSLSAITALGLVLLPGSAAAQQKTLKEQLVGGWHLAALERTESDGTKVHTYGANPKGIAYYGADGRFFVLFARGDLPKIAANDRAKATSEEAKAIVDGTIAYSGTYTVDEASKTIILRLEVTTFPNSSLIQKRTITSLTANELKFTNPTTSTGARIEGTMKRAPAAATN